MATCGESKKPSLMWIVDICDLIEAGDVEPKTVLDSIKTKLKWESDCTILLTLQVLESIVKNCGDFINDELTTKTFCDMLHNLARTTRHDGVKQKLLELIQTWDYVFGGKPQHINLRVLLNTMKAEGFIFPQLQVSNALFVVYGALRSNQMAQKSEPARNKNKDFLNNLTQKATDEGQLSSNAATSRSGQYNQRPIMMQTNGDSITSRFRDVEPFKSGSPTQNLCHLKQHVPQSSAQNASTGKNVTKMTSLFPSQTPPQNYPFHNSLSKCRSRQTVLPSYVSPTTTTQSLPQINNVQQSQGIPPLASPPSKTSSAQNGSTGQKTTKITNLTASQVPSKNHAFKKMFALKQSRKVGLTSQMQPTTAQTLPQTDPVPQPEQIPPPTSTPDETRPVRLTQKEKLELMRKKKQEFLKKQQELATQNNQEQ